MNNIEKIVFLAITNCQQGKVTYDSTNPTFVKLTSEEQTLFTKSIFPEIELIFKEVNRKFMPQNDKFDITCFNDYKEFIGIKNEIVDTVASEFNLDFKEEISNELKALKESLLKK